MFYKFFDRGEVGDNLGVLVRGLKCEEVKCGMVLCVFGIVKLYIKFEV